MECVCVCDCEACVRVCEECVRVCVCEECVVFSGPESDCHVVGTQRLVT